MRVELKLNPYDKQVIRWAYGRDGSDRNYEIESDGETFVKDLFADGLIKSPAGVGHDYPNRVLFHETPDMHIWTPAQDNFLYLRLMYAIGYPLWRALWRWRGVTWSRKHWWKEYPSPKPPHGNTLAFAG